MEQRPNGFWNNENVLTLGEMWEKNASLTEIANELGTTRNAVAGKRYRLELPKRLKPEPTDPPPPRKPKMNKPKPRSPEEIQAAREAARAKFLELSHIPEVGENGVSIMELNGKHCRFVIGKGNDGLARYCGKPKFGSSWCCSDHLFVCYDRSRYIDYAI